MRIVSYVHLNRLPNPTGVGKHIERMIERLNSAPRLDLSLLVSQQQLCTFPPGVLPID